MKNETKGIAPLILAVVVIVVAAGVGVGSYVVVTRGGGGGGGGTGGDIGSATSLSFNVTDTAAGLTASFKANDIGSSSMKMRIEGAYGGEDTGFILNGAQQTCWIKYGGEWTEMQSFYTTYWNIFYQLFSGYQTGLGSWTGSGSITVGTATISDISTVELSDSLFQV